MFTTRPDLQSRRSQPDWHFAAVHRVTPDALGHAGHLPQLGMLHGSQLEAPHSIHGFGPSAEAPYPPASLALHQEWPEHL